MVTRDARPAPANVAIVQENRMLSITWQDGHAGVYPFGFLRGACPCTLCKGSHRPREVSQVVPVPGVHLLAYAPVGSYALRFLWSDRHDTGIYDYQYLRTLCRCDRCVPRRIDEGMTV